MDAEMWGTITGKTADFRDGRTFIINIEVSETDFDNLDLGRVVSISPSTTKRIPL